MKNLKKYFKVIITAVISFFMSLIPGKDAETFIHKVGAASGRYHAGAEKPETAQYRVSRARTAYGTILENKNLHRQKKKKLSDNLFVWQKKSCQWSRGPNIIVDS